MIKMIKQSAMILALAVNVMTPALSEEKAPPVGQPETAAPPAKVGDGVPAAEAQPAKPPAVEAGKPPAARQPVVMAWVGERKITVDEFMKYMSQDTRLVVKSTTNSGKAEVLREMILDRLIEEGIRREGLLPADKPATQQDYLRAYNTLAARRFPEANAVPEEEKLYQYYLDNQQSFGIPATVRISQIQLRLPAKASPEERNAVKARAEEILKRLQKGESFGELAKALTENPKAKVAEGDLGFLPLNQDPWLDKAVSGLQIGQFSEVLESPAGYEIILLKERREALIAPYANVRDTVISKMRQDAHRKAREAYAWQLAKEVGVRVEMEELKSAIP